MSEVLSARVQRLSLRAATLYRWFADVDRADAPLHAIWTILARHEDAHRAAASGADAGAGDEVDASLHELARRLAAGERLDAHDPVDRRLSAALAIELARFDVCRRTTERRGGLRPRDEADVRALADLALQRSQSPQVRLAAAVLLTRHNLAAGERGPT